MSTLLELRHVIADVQVGAANACVAFDVHVVAKGNDDLLDLLGELAC